MQTEHSHIWNILLVNHSRNSIWKVSEMSLDVHRCNHISRKQIGSIVWIYSENWKYTNYWMRGNCCLCQTLTVDDNIIESVMNHTILLNGWKRKVRWLYQTSTFCRDHLLVKFNIYFFLFSANTVDSNNWSTSITCIQTEHTLIIEDNRAPFYSPVHSFTTPE